MTTSDFSALVPPSPVDLRLPLDVLGRFASDLASALASVWAAPAVPARPASSSSSPARHRPPTQRAPLVQGQGRVVDEYMVANRRGEELLTTTMRRACTCRHQCCFSPTVAVAQTPSTVCKAHTRNQCPCHTGHRLETSKGGHNKGAGNRIICTLLRSVHVLRLARKSALWNMKWSGAKLLGVCGAVDATQMKREALHPRT